MQKIILASNNAHKVEEIKAILNEVEILSLKEINFIEEIDEVAETFEENAMLKAVTVFDDSEIPVIGDDSGLEVEALNGAPGVLSARYAGTNNSEDNIQKLLLALEGKENRKAQFRCVLCLFDGKTERYFEGIVKGSITTQSIGKGGFGYDSVFIPEGYDKTFAELGSSVKNKISHRALALEKLKDFF